MTAFNFFYYLRSKITGLNAINARFDALQEGLSAISDSLKNLEMLATCEPESDLLKQPVKTLNNTNQADESSQGALTSACSISEIVDDLNKIFSEEQSIHRIAFLVHDPIMLVHYADVWKAMGASAFTIVLTEFFSEDREGNNKLGLSNFFEHVDAEGYEVRNSEEIINCGIKFEYVVTNHVISGSTQDTKVETEDERLKKLINLGLVSKGKSVKWEFGVDECTYLPLQIGNKQIRYMYGADISDGWSLQNWNNIYDIFLCHGVNDEREISKRFKGKTFVMGYPRYDRYFSEDIDLSNVRHEFNISQSKKTVLWMPTLGEEYSSIPLFAEVLSRICQKYNVIVRPHPFSFVVEKEYIQLLENYNFNIDRNVLRDMNELFGIADVVLVDNGGTPFSAIFLGKNILFLDVPEDLGPESAATSHIAGSSVLELKKHLPIVKQQDMQRLECMLDSEAFYKENSDAVDVLFKKYFDSPRGGGAQRVSAILGSL